MPKLIGRGGKLIARGGKLLGRTPPCWKGVMTVGGTAIVIGWSKYNFGAITNTPVVNCSGGELDTIYWRSDNNRLIVGGSGGVRVNSIEINNEVYNINGNSFIELLVNPFPPAGETCTIRILS